MNSDAEWRTKNGRSFAAVTVKDVEIREEKESEGSSLHPSKQKNRSFPLVLSKIEGFFLFTLKR